MTIRSTMMKRRSARTVGAEEREAAERAARWEAEAPTIGWCTGCGTHVNEPAGVLHRGCMPASTGRST